MCREEEKKKKPRFIFLREGKDVVTYTGERKWLHRTSKSDNKMNRTLYINPEAKTKRIGKYGKTIGETHETNRCNSG